MHEFEVDLRKMIKGRNVVAIIGSGVSMATNKNSPTWRDLIELANKRCQAVGADGGWCQSVTNLLAQPEADMLIAAAELVHNKLSMNGGGELQNWLRATFENLKPADRTVIRALAALKIPLITTNYDGLIEEVTKIAHATWNASATVARVLRGEEPRVLHLHGHWEDSASIVLGIRSYETLRQDPHIQAVLKAFAITKSFLFVGCGDEGLSDPNFGNFLTWLKTIDMSAGVEHRHYRLVRRDENVAPIGRVYPLVYGEDYADLPAFLQRINPKSIAPNDGSNRAQQMHAVANQGKPAPQTSPNIVTNSIGMKLTTIPAGQFLMGSKNEEGQRGNEGPQHEVELTRGFYLGVHPVTQGEYQQVVGSNPSRFSGARQRPVEQVSWLDAVVFCNRLSKREKREAFYNVIGQEVQIVGGDGYRLPTEAEWEYACRAGTTTPWWFGDHELRLRDFAWYHLNSGNTTHPVGEKPANDWGLHDMYGNVCEWCQDRFSSEYYADSPKCDPLGPDAGQGRVLRGGSWGYYPDQCQSAFRYFSTLPGSQNASYGFRVARTENLVS